ncbi:MAG: Ig-like domain-containing protein, partial [Candidatus Heimdallarchaeaceae archaeon]
MTKSFFKNKIKMKLAVLALIVIVVAQPLVTYPGAGQNSNENYATIDLTELLRQLFAEQLSAGLDVETRTGRSITPVPQALGAPQLKSPPNGATITDNTPTLEWYSVSGATGYIIEVDDNSAFSSPDHYVVSRTSYTLPQMADGKYYWHVQASSITLRMQAEENASAIEPKIGNPWSETWSFTINTGPLPPPTLNSPAHGSVVADSTPTFTWSTVSGASAYQLQVATSLTYSAPYIDEVLVTTSYTSTIDLPDRTFYWHVRTRNSAGVWGSWSSSHSFTIDTTGPDPPTHVYPAADSRINTHYPTFQWEGTADSTYYALRVWKFEDVTPIIDIQTSSTSYDSSYLADDQYTWQVRARDAYGNWGAWSTMTTFYVDTVAPSTPTPQTPSLHSRTSNVRPKFIWSSVSDAVEYQLQVSYASDFSLNVIDVKVSTNSYTPTSDMSNGKWYWRVKARDEAGNWSGWSTVYDFTIDTYGPPAPELNSPSNGAVIKDSTPTLDWTAPSVDNPSGYQVQIARDSSFSDLVIDVQVSGTSYTPSTALSDRTYYWRVRAKDDLNNWGSWSDVWSFTVDTVAPDRPTPNSPADDDRLNYNTITFTWDGPSDAVEYRIQIYEFEEIQPLVDTTVSSESFTYSIWNDGHYMWRVAAIDQA